MRLPQSLHNSTKSGKPSTETIADFPNFHWTFLLNQKKTTSQKISSHLTRLSVNCMRIQPISWKLILVSSRKVDLFLRFSGQGNNYDFDPRWLKSIRSDRFMFLNVGSARQTCFLRGQLDILLIHTYREMQERINYIDLTFASLFDSEAAGFSNLNICSY